MATTVPPLAAQLEWVLVRPLRFVNESRGQPRVLRSGDKGLVGHVSRQGLARVVIDAAERPDYVHQAIVVGCQANGPLACEFFKLPSAGIAVLRCADEPGVRQALILVRPRDGEPA